MPFWLTKLCFIFTEDDDDVVILEDEDAVVDKSNLDQDVDELIQDIANDSSLQKNEEVCSTNDTYRDESSAQDSGVKDLDLEPSVKDLDLEISGSRTIHKCQLCEKVS